MKTRKFLRIEKRRISEQRKLDKSSLKNNPNLQPTPMLEIARMCNAIKGVCNHWTATYRRGPEGYMIFRNPANPGVLPLP